MSRFFVGQLVRVRYTRSDSLGWTHGMEGRIIELGPWKAGEAHKGHFRYFPMDADCLVETKLAGVGAPLFEQLEPILPEGHQSAELDVHELLPFLKDRVTA